jgi:hypothetical protein
MAGYSDSEEDGNVGGDGDTVISEIERGGDGDN